MAAKLVKRNIAVCSVMTESLVSCTQHTYTRTHSHIQYWYTSIDESVENLQVPLATRIKITRFLDVAPCSFVEIHRLFRGTYCLHHQGNNCKA